MRLKSVFLIMETETGYMAFTSDRESFHGVIRLNEIAGKVFEQLIEDTPVSKMVDSIADSFKTETDTAAGAVFRCIKLLDKAGLVISDDEEIEECEASSDFMPVIEFMAHENDEENYADMNTGCYYNFCECFSYDDCWGKK